MTMRQGWESEARNWTRNARTRGNDRSHENINLPVLLDLLPAPGRRALDLACGEGRLGRLLQTQHYQIVGARRLTHDDPVRRCLPEERAGRAGGCHAT